MDVPGRSASEATAFPATSVDRAGDAASAATSLKVLLADDHPMNRKLVALMLSVDGFALTSVEDGAAAVQAFKVEHFDVVLMDMQMPVMDGLSAIREIRAWEQVHGKARTPILALTAHALPEHARAALAAGADARLVKPITSATLLGGVNAALSRTSDAAPTETEPLRATR